MNSATWLGCRTLCAAAVWLVLAAFTVDGWATPVRGSASSQPGTMWAAEPLLRATDPRLRTEPAPHGERHTDAVGADGSRTPGAPGGRTAAGQRA